jgi:hypothetical protein
MTITLQRPANGQWNMFGFNLFLNSSSHCFILGVTKGFTSPTQSKAGLSLYTRLNDNSTGPWLIQWHRHSVRVPKVLVGLYLIAVVDHFSKCLLPTKA